MHFRSLFAVDRQTMVSLKEWGHWHSLLCVRFSQHQMRGAFYSQRERGEREWSLREKEGDAKKKGGEKKIWCLVERTDTPPTFVFGLHDERNCVDIALSPNSSVAWLELAVSSPGSRVRAQILAELQRSPLLCFYTVISN